MKTRLAIGLSIALASCSVLADEPLKFAVVGIDCEACAPPILKALKSLPDVKNPKLDWKAGSATVDVPAGYDREKIRTALKEIGFEAVFEGEERADLKPLPEDVVARLDIAPASRGEKIDVARVVVPGKVTLVDYWAEWCGPCRVLEGRLQRLVMGNPKVAVRRVDVGKWDNAAAKQATSEFRVESLPYVRVYDAGGKFVGAQTGGSWDKILKLVEKAQGR
jgi:thiol-disulfide isomerase/thioredoxin